jgi:hypothetical protein
MIVDVAFAVVPSILGFGAAGLIGSAAIRTAKDVMNSISVLRSLGPGIRYQIDFHKIRKETAGRWIQSDSRLARSAAFFLAPIQSGIFLWKKKHQNTQGNQDEQGGGGGESPPTPPNTEPDIIISYEEYLKREE